MTCMFYVPQINGKPLQYIFPHARLKLLRDPKDHTVSGKNNKTQTKYTPGFIRMLIK